MLVSKKVDVLGVGLNKHSTVSDQWWMRAFDLSLKSFGTGQESVLSSVQKHGVNRGGLYGRFVKGEKLEGSIGDSEKVPIRKEAGAIGSSPSVDKSDAPKRGRPEAGANRGAELEAGADDKMAIDVPPPDKLERVVGEHENQHSHDAMMYLLENPQDAPASMHKMLDRKRKRAEQPAEKRARRKTERGDRAKMEATEKKKGAIEDGTFNAAEEEERRRMRDIDRRATEFVLEAQRQGLIPVGPNEIRRGIVSTGANATAIDNGRIPELRQVYDQAGLNTQVKFKGSGKDSLKAQKYAREKMKRELKRAAKAYLLGEKPPHEQTAVEKREKREKKRLATAQKKADAAKKDAERMAMREERAARKREKRMEKAREKAEVDRIIADREAARKADESANGNGETARPGNDFGAGADEVKFNMNSKGGKKKIPGVGTVDRYPTKAEKKAKKLAALAIKEGKSEQEIQARFDAEKAEKQAQERLKVERYRAMKHGMSLEQYQAALAKGDVHSPVIEKKDLSPEKLAEYRKRAEQKGMSLEDYIRNRERKRAEKESEEMGNPFQKDILDAEDHEDVIYVDTEAATNGGGEPKTKGLVFAVDTVGDSTLAAADIDAPTNFIQKTRSVIAQGSKPLAVVDTAGDDAYTTAANMPVPLDPRIWEGKNVKELPRHIRKARQEWMKLKREDKKARQAEAPGRKADLTPKKSKGQRKIEAREAFVKKILYESRKVLAQGGGDGMMTIEVPNGSGKDTTKIENVPLVKVESREGMFKKSEVGLARTVARRVLRNVRREVKAEKGKGKGFKKRERAAKERARDAGISGPTDKVKYVGAGREVPDLLL